MSVPLFIVDMRMDPSMSFIFVSSDDYQFTRVSMSILFFQDPEI